MDAETRRMLAIAEGMAKSQAALGNDGSALAWSEMAATITRLTAERDEARAECEQLRAMIAWNQMKGAGMSDDAAYAALRERERAALTQEATDGQG